MEKFKYIASCNFTLFYPELSLRILNFLSERPEMDIVRCCSAKYKVREFEEKMPPTVAQTWKDTVHYSAFAPETTMVSVCQNCTSIFQESQPDIRVLSLWEYMLDCVPDFPYPDYGGAKMTLQDCWRQHDNRLQQEAVRKLLKKMNIEVVELSENRAETKFCGVSTLRPAPKRNLAMAPRRYVEEAQEFFAPHTPEAQLEYMKDYCKQITTEAVVAYCHYCTQGFGLVGQKHFHLAELLFADR